MAATKGTQTNAKVAKTAKAKTRKNLDKMVGENPTTATGYQAYYRACLKAGKVLDY